MTGFEIAGCILLAAVSIAGILVKMATRRKLRDMDGMSDLFTDKGSGSTKVIGKF